MSRKNFEAIPEDFLTKLSTQNLNIYFNIISGDSYCEIGFTST